MANPEPVAVEPSARKRPGKSVWIRLAIYVPLLGFFGWQAGARALDEREAADQAFRTDVAIWLESPPGMMDLSGAIEVQSEAMLSAPPGDETGTTGTTGDTGTTDTTGDTGTTDETGTTSDTGTTSTTSTTGEPAPEPVPTDATSTSTSTGTAPPP